MKKMVSLLMAVLMVSLFSVSALAAVPPTYEPNVGGSGTGYMEVVQSTVLKESSAFIMWHPDVSAPEKNVSTWYFSYSTSSCSVSIGGSVVSITFNPRATSAGRGYDCSSNQWSRPAIYGDIYEQTYLAGIYNYNTKRWVSVNTRTRTVVQDTYIVIEESAVKSNLY